MAARRLGLDPLGIEWDDAACATRRAAGLRTLQADVAALDPLCLPCVCDHTAEEMEAACSPWHRVGCPREIVGINERQKPVTGLIGSPPCQAYSMAGKGAGRRDVEHVIACAMELAAGTDSRAGHRAKCEDERSLLVVEPLRWALALRPRWIVLEQVPPVLELWTLFARLLSEHGYSTWTGVLEAERYGVPQTRERAVLMARLDGPVEPPRATHQRYVPGEPQRHDLTMDGEVLPWVSMAEALGWGDESVTMREEFERANEAARPMSEPAGTLTGTGGSHRRKWVYNRPSPTIVGGRRSKDGMLVGRQLPEGEGENVGGWGWERPATNVNCDPRISAPGHHDANESGSQQKGAVRVTVQEAAVLQSFPVDYPWQGSRTKQFEQVGNAIPPGLAEPVLRAVTACASPAASEKPSAAEWFLP